MKFLAISSLIAAVAAVPVAELTERQAPQIIFPTSISTYNVGTGAVTYKTTIGRVFKHPTNHGQDYTTLGTYYFPPQYAGWNCEFLFDIGGYDSLYTGSRKVDLFLSQKPATATTTSWPQGNLRDQHVARMEIDAYTGRGKFIEGTGGKFKCPMGEYAGEIVGVYDEIDLYWRQDHAKGPYFIAYP